MEVRYVEISKADSTKTRILGISNIIDRVIQLQFLILLDPVIESKLPEHFYGFRKGRSAHQALGFLSKSIISSDLSRFVLVQIDIEKCFDNISHEFIINHFPFPRKYTKLLYRWISCVRVDSNKEKTRLTSGIPQGSVLGPLVCNYVLSIIFNGIWDDNKFFPKNPVITNMCGNIRNLEVSRYMLGYADDIIFKVISLEEANNLIMILKERLAIAGLRLNQEKVLIIDLNRKSRFD